MLIQAYGLFWRADEVEWLPGRGVKGEFRLLGRIGANRGTLRVADMRDQVALYVLHDDWGVYYVGLTLEQSIGARIRQHLGDRHADSWDRFSWFGFRPVLKRQDSEGLCELKPLASTSAGRPTDAVRDMEALLIQLHNPRGNRSKMGFVRAEQWTQILWDQRAMYLDRL